MKPNNFKVSVLKNIKVLKKHKSNTIFVCYCENILKKKIFKKLFFILDI